MVNSYNQICKDLIYVLKLLIYFDTYEIQSGGAGAALGAAAKMAPAAAGAAAAAAPAPPGGAPAAGAPPAGDAKGGDAGSKAEQADKNEANEEKKKKENKSKNRMLAIFSWLTNLIMGILKWFAKGFIKFSSMMVFAATFPIIPFFAVMAGMYGIIKYFMYKLRRL